MARPLDHGKRAELLQEVCRYIGVHGLDDLTLRPLAAALGTSSRMLIYYFDSRENLIVQALASQRPAFADMFDGVENLSGLETRLNLLWRNMTVGPDEVSSRILMQVLGIATIKGGIFAEYARSTVLALTEALANAYTRCGHAPDESWLEATILGAGFRGLLIDRFSTGQPERTDLAAAMLFGSVVSVSSSRREGTG
ncbi:TetR family transcriptional regulator [Rhodococcoides yunnanense]|uniref:TetR family transcriptional regulator n=1 Tax=Rhodococcoides yunnanense TaxID=278209 RepID=UPI0009330579|nr:TetR family transcriptional regulator [Rhodococcus yunnanensis]